MRPPTLTISRRFMGPPTSANGGYVAGVLASYLPRAGAVRVTLREPPPLDTPLQVVQAPESVQASFGGALVADAVSAALDVVAVEPVSYEEALAASANYLGLHAHPFPTCFVCGSDRKAPDALGLRPRPLPERSGTTAAAWRPDASLAGSEDEQVPTEMVWAALDCPGGWTLGQEGRPAVLGRMTAAIDARPRPGDRCVILGRRLGTDGRKSYTTTTMYDDDGRVLARAHAVWITVDPAAFGRPGPGPVSS